MKKYERSIRIIVYCRRYFLPNERVNWLIRVPVTAEMSKRKLHKWSIDFTGSGRPKGEKAIIQLNTDLRKPLGIGLLINHCPLINKLLEFSDWERHLSENKYMLHVCLLLFLGI